MFLWSAVDMLPRDLKAFFKLDYLNKGRILNNVFVMFALVVALQLPLVSATRRATLQKIDDCKASFNGQLINLEPLARLDGKPRFEVEYEGWKYSYNPCFSFNLPRNPHEGKGDRCHYVTMCKWQQSRSGPDQYFTLGIERTTKFLIRRPGEEKDGKHEPTAHLTGKSGKSETDVNQLGDTHGEPVPGGGTINNTQFAPESSESFGNDSSESFSNDTSSESLGNSSEEGNDTYSEGLSSSEEQSNIALPTDSQNKNFSRLSEIFQSIYPLKDSSELQDNITAKARVEKRSAYLKYNHWFTHLLKLKENLNERSNNREKRDTLETRAAENNAEESESSESEEEDEEDEDDEEENMTSEEVNLIIKLRGIRRMKRQKSLIYLICDMKRSGVEDVLFLLREFEDKDIIFELHHRCCCPGLCEFGLENSVNGSDVLSAIDKRFKELEERGPKFLWLVLVVNVAIILAAILIGTTFCRKGGSGPNNMLPS